MPRPEGIERAVALLADPADRRAPAPRGWLDLIGAGEGPASTGLAQDLMLTRLLPAVYERWWRPAWSRVARGVTAAGMGDEHRIARLISGLPQDDPARIEGEREIARLQELGLLGEFRGDPHEEGLAPLPSLDPRAAHSDA